jgi:hypothetical protein
VREDNKGEDKPNLNPLSLQKRVFFTEQTSKTLEGPYRRLLRRLLFYLDPPPVCHSLPPSIIPLFFLSPAPTTLYNVRNTLGRKLLVSLLSLAWPYKLRHEVDALGLFMPVNGRGGGAKNMRSLRPPTATEDLMVSTTYGVQEPTIVCHLSEA